MKCIATLLALGIAAAAPNAFAQASESTELSITGLILPSSCTVELGNDGNADLGEINAINLNHDTFTDLVRTTISLSVACEAEVRYAFFATDNVPASNAYNVDYYGLGMTAGQKKIGGAKIYIENVTLDGVPGFGTQSYNNGGSWTDAGNVPVGNILNRNQLRGYSWVQGSRYGPTPVKNLVGRLEIAPRIQATTALAIDDDTPIRGSVALNLFYL